MAQRTQKKNIKKESAHYLLRHQTPLFIQALAKDDCRPVGSYLDVLIEQEARKVLSPDEFEQIIEQGKRKEAERAAENQEESV